MTIELITQKEHDLLKEIHEKFPALILDNKGFEGIDRSKFTPEEKEADRTVKMILKGCIHGFSYFQNFKPGKTSGDMYLRFQYRWDDHFTGVGYITLRELLNGFDQVYPDPNGYLLKGIDKSKPFLFQVHKHGKKAIERTWYYIKKPENKAGHCINSATWFSYYDHEYPVAPPLDHDKL